ncbi:MAG: hypothetical protein JWM86_446 [Thermoleophilia bacterium]|nr:hypothetical protein [Thermoleophilia bacterium]
MTRLAPRTPLLLAIGFAWLVAMLIPLTSGAFWPIVAATDVLRDHAVHFTDDAVSVLPIRGDEIVVQPWLSALLLKGTWEIGGVTGLVVLQGVLAALTAAGAYLVARAHARPAVAAAAAVAFTLLIQPSTLRTEQLALMIGVGLLLVLQGRRWWLAPVLIALWANVHGSFVIGVAIVIAAAIGMLRAPAEGAPLARRSWAVRFGLGAACVLATLATTLGTGIFDYVRSVEGVGALAELTPIWRPMDPLGARAISCYAALILLVAAAIRRARPLAARDAVASLLPLIPVLVLLAATFTSVRYVVWFALLALPELAATARRMPTEQQPEERSFSVSGLTVLVALALGIAVLLPGLPIQRDFAHLGLPAQKLYRDVEESDVVFASPEWGDYIHLRTEARIVIDARLERYREGDLDAFLAFRDHQDDALIRQTSPDWLILHRQTLDDSWGSLRELRRVGETDVTIEARDGDDATFAIG